MPTYREMKEGNKAEAALKQQLEAVEAHVLRLVDVTSRYKIGTIERALADTQLALWIQVTIVLKANLDGRVVPPS